MIVLFLDGLEFWVYRVVRYKLKDLINLVVCK